MLKKRQGGTSSHLAAFGVDRPRQSDADTGGLREAGDDAHNGGEETGFAGFDSGLAALATEMAEMIDETIFGGGATDVNCKICHGDSSLRDGGFDPLFISVQPCLSDRGDGGGGIWAGVSHENLRGMGGGGDTKSKLDVRCHAKVAVIVHGNQ